jgi:hypothetical protein
MYQTFRLMPDCSSCTVLFIEECCTAALPSGLLENNRWRLRYTVCSLNFWREGEKERERETTWSPLFMTCYIPDTGKRKN